MAHREPKTNQQRVSQRERFESAARELGTDDDPERFKAIVQRIAKAPPATNGPSKAKPKSTKPGQ